MLLSAQCAPFWALPHVWRNEEVAQSPRGRRGAGRLPPWLSWSEGQTGAWANTLVLPARRNWRAVHAARQSLRTGETEVALAGAVTPTLSPDGVAAPALWGVLPPAAATRPI
ncbi:beta-ketoacyl synthase N-terminal-like domain-containing protein [Streptomyces sp. NPDC007100]|uniref:beta-ketoacyl synthase N-terminal-like domain-containing protein n=1 Tax=Streptomyces sp. NPDC007100 TaxID=3155602 RepID=UPI0034026E48